MLIKDNVKDNNEEERVRCFIALDLPREIIKEVERVQHEIEKKNIFYGKFTESENLHLTLKFLGEISHNKVDDVKEKLKEIEHEGFKAKLNGIGVFSPKFVKIVWMKILGKGVFSLQEEIDNKMNEIGFEKENRFMSHLTIARVKNVKDKKMFLQELDKIKSREIGFDVNGFYLIKSVLKADGPEYEVLESFDML